MNERINNLMTSNTSLLAQLSEALGRNGELEKGIKTLGAMYIDDDSLLPQWLKQILSDNK